MISEERKNKMLPHIEKLEGYLQKEGILYQGLDNLGNAVFTGNGKVKKIRGEEFFRVSGICTYKKDLEGTFFELVPMTDAMFYSSWLFTVLMFVFYPPKPKV